MPLPMLLVKNHAPAVRRRLVFGLASILLVSTALLSDQVRGDDRLPGAIEHEVQSTYSHIRIRRAGNIRTMIFVRDSGEEAYESQMNMRSPHLLRFSYLQHMFTSYLLQPEQKKVLIVGLGGGSMVHFLQKHAPECEVDAVEIDPVVVQLAERYFAVKRNKNVRLIVADAFDYFRKNETKYDVIYMDAFLKPSASTDETGVPLRLRTIDFYKQLQSRLNDGGSVVFNINPHPEMKADLETIAEAFPQGYVFSLPNSEGVVAIGSLQPSRKKSDELRAAGREMDRRFRSAGFSFETLASHLRK
ncbi:MAG: spermidine synthase [Planctomycetota bacterium]